MADNSAKVFEEVNQGVKSIAKSLQQSASPADKKKMEEMKMEAAESLAAAGKIAVKNAEEEKKERPLRLANIAFMGQVFKNSMKAGWQHARSQFQSIISTIGGHIREVLGPVAAAFDAAKAALTGTFNFIKGTILSFKDKTPEADKKRNGFLKSIQTELVKQRKGEFAESLGKDGKKKTPGMITMIVAALAGIVGGIVGAILMPFTVLLKVLKTVGMIATKIPKVGKIFSAFGKVFGFLGKIGKGVAWLLTKIPIVRTLFAGFKVGFKFLGWPIQVIFLLIDFIDGFRKEFGESGSIIESIGAGLRSAFLGFIELPVKLIGWVVDKVLEMFGVEGAESANKIMTFFRKAFDIYWKYVKGIIAVVTFAFKLIWGFVKPIAKYLGEKLKPIAKLLWIAIKWFAEVFWVKIKKVLDFFGYEFEEEEKQPKKPKKTRKEIDAELEALRKKEREIAKKKAEEEKKAREEAERLAKAQLAAQEAAAEINAVAAGGQGGSVTETPPQIQDEVDNWGVTSKNYDMEMGGA